MISIILRTVGVVGCVVIAGLAAGVAWMGAGAATDDSGAVYRATGYSRALYDQLERKRREQPNVISNPESAARQLMHRAPLYDAPLALIGLSAVGEGRSADADSAFSAAFARNPRNVPSRLWLAHRALERGEVDLAVEIVSGLFSVSPGQFWSFVDALASVAVVPGGIEGLEKRIGRQPRLPDWAGPVVARVNILAPDLDRLISLNRITPSTQEAFIMRMITTHGVEAGFRAWRSLLPQSVNHDFMWPYDGTFATEEGAPPFNWLIQSDLAERTRAGGLSVSYLGRERPAFVEQLMLLKPGRYTFTTTLSGDATAGGGVLVWAVECSAATAQLGAVAIRELSPVLSREGFEFTVPGDDCISQRLVLRGEPGEFPARTRAEIKSVAITPMADDQ